MGAWIMGIPMVDVHPDLRYVYRDAAIRSKGLDKEGTEAKELLLSFHHGIQNYRKRNSIYYFYVSKLRLNCRKTIRCLVTNLMQCGVWITRLTFPFK